MSGGFFRGTSADQDTRFSNKQAKLLKSQKFPPELDHLVDMRKVKMDVIRPWIATRATELLGFEDEVLINFVYGLLDGQEVDGKQIQIQLTGFMEKNTGKFMKELWGLLLSAQKNASGVPQQFLDAKEEEMRKKKAETDMIAQEIQKRREKEMPERGHRSRNDGEADISRSGNAAVDSVPKHIATRAASIHSGEERELDVRHGRRSKDRYSRSPSSSKSPHTNNHSPVLKRDSPSATRSSSKTFSKSRSYSEEKRKSRSASISSKSQRHSSSPERRRRSPVRRSVSPARRYRSPLRRSISPHRRYSPRNRSPSRRRHRSPSLTRRRSPHASSPLRRRQRSPSPTRRRSPPTRRRSPFVRRRSPSPFRRRSPSPRRRSPVRRRSPSPYYRRSPPIRRRSPSPLRRRSPLSRSPKHRRRSPLHSARNRAIDSQVSPLRSRKRSRSPHRNQGRRSLSRERDSRINGVGSKRYENEHASHRTYEKRSPYRAVDRGAAEHPDLGRSVSHRLPTSLRSPQQDSRDRHVNRNREAEKSPNQSLSPDPTRETMIRKNRRSPSMSESPVRHTKEQMRHYNSPKTGRNEKKTSLAREDASRGNDSVHSQSEDLPADKGQKKFHDSDFSPEVYVTKRPAEDHTPSPRGRPAKMEVTNAGEEGRDMEFAERHVQGISPSLEGVQYGTARSRQSTPPDHVHDRQHSTKKRARDRSSSEERGQNDQAVKQSSLDGRKLNDEKWPSKNEEYRESHHKIQSVAKSKRKEDRNDSDAISSDSEDAEINKSLSMEKRRHKRSDRHKKDVDDTSESDSQVEDRKEAKKRRKEEKRLRKEEKRRRREEKHRRKLERRTNKLKMKPMDTVALPSDKANNLNNSDESDVDVPMRNDSHPSSTEEAESEQKKLEFELRKKALESLRLKKAISH